MGKASRGKWERRMERALLVAVSTSEEDTLRGRLAVVASLLMGGVMFVLPQNIYYISGVIIFCVICLGYGAFYGWGFRCNSIIKVAIFLATSVVMVYLGYVRWPRIKVSPAQISFRGISQETYDFTVRNETDSDAYLVRIPFRVPNGMDGKIEPRVAKDEIDSSLPLEEYGYCYGNDGHEYVVAEIPVLGSRQFRRFSLIYSGGPQAKAMAGVITSVDEQPPHSPTLQAGGITGDYRVCHMQGHVK